MLSVKYESKLELRRSKYLEICQAMSMRNVIQNIDRAPISLLHKLMGLRN